MGAEPTGPPPPLPQGWILKASKSQTGAFYYYNLETGVSSWDRPIDADIADAAAAALQAVVAPTAALQAEDAPPPSLQPEEPKRPAEETAAEPAPKKARKAPKEVRVYHILRKHKDSKRPSSWRVPKITISREEAIDELQGLLDILREESGESLLATFKELAKDESDCSSAKRNGDLGFFGRKKMRPEFEKAAFALEIGELSDIVETSSGAHVLLRVG